MVGNVQISEEAEEDFQTIYKYIRSEFGVPAANRFGATVIKFVSILQDFPEIGKTEKVKGKDIRCFVVHHRLKIFYRIKKGQIFVLRLFDTRQNPNSI